MDRAVVNKSGYCDYLGKTVRLTVVYDVIRKPKSKPEGKLTSNPCPNAAECPDLSECPVVPRVTSL